MPGKFTLGRNERLKSRKLIEKLFGAGKSFQSGCLRVYYLVDVAIDKESARGHRINMQFGVSASAKNFKRAVDRNRIKRLMRESWRLQKKRLEDKLNERALVVFFIYTAKELPVYKTVYDQTGLALKKLLKKFDEDHSPNS